MNRPFASLKATNLPVRVRALVAGFVALVAVIFAAGWFINVMAANTYWARHTLEVQKSVSRSFSLLQDAETGQRGYLLTGDPAYLAPFSGAEAKIDAELDALSHEVEDNPAEVQAVADFRAIAEAKRAELRKTIELRHTGDPDAALSLVRAGAGKQLMDRAREAVGRMQAAEENLLSSRIEQGKRSLTIFKTSSLSPDQLRFYLLSLRYIMYASIFGNYASPTKALRRKPSNAIGLKVSCGNRKRWKSSAS